MSLEELEKEYDKLQKKYGAKNLRSIYNGGCINNPDWCFVFINPTGRNVACLVNWNGIRSPWLGTKNIWDLFYQVGLQDEKIYKKIKQIKGSEWNEAFAKEVYDDIANHQVFITNLGKCTQVDARPLPDSVYKAYLSLLEKEIAIVDPKVKVLFGNQVSSIVLGKKISVSQVRCQEFIHKIGNKEYKCYCIYYPIGNGRFNIDKSIHDILWIKDNLLTQKA